MGCLVNLVYYLLIALLAVFAGGLAFILLGPALFVVILILGVAWWGYGIWREPGTGGFWHRVGERLVGRWSRKASPGRAAPSAPSSPVVRSFPPSFSPSVINPNLPDHVIGLADDLAPLLARLYRALHRPDSLPATVHAGGVASHLSLAGATLWNLHEALVALKEEVVEAEFPGEENRSEVLARNGEAVEGLIDAYAAAFTSLRAQPWDQQLIRLEHNLRANMERLTMWLASLLRIMQEPERILLEGEADGGSMVMTFNLRFSWPEGVEDLDTWVDTPTGYDAGEVREALAMHRAAPSGEVGPSQVMAAPGGGRLGDSLCHRLDRGRCAVR